MNNKISGVNKSLWTAYNFEDHVWHKAPTLSHNSSNFLELARHAIKIDGVYLVRTFGGNWQMIKKDQDAIKFAMNNWFDTQLINGTVVDSDMINEFFKGEQLQTAKIGGKSVDTKVLVGSCPQLHQTIHIPLGPQFVHYNKHQYLNVWENEMAVADVAELPVGKIVLLMVYGALCNGTVDTNNVAAEAERVYQMVVTDRYDNKEFRFLMNWLAALYQRPGINLLTNVWLLGQTEGIGKGTLLDIMANVLGHSVVGKLNQAEVEAGWNDHLVGLQLVEVNEFQSSSKMGASAWSAWIKGHTIEPELKIRKRNTTSYSVPNVGNYIFTSNAIDQKIANRNDRRNQFIQTTSDLFWSTYAQNLQGSYLKIDPRRTGRGFACILDQVKVDLDLIKRSFINELRIEITNSDKSEVDLWLESDSGRQHIGAKFQPATAMFEDFKGYWVESHTGNAPSVSMSIWGKLMKQHPQVENKRTSAGVEYRVRDEAVEVQLPPALESVSTSADKITPAFETARVIDLDHRVEPVKLQPLTAMERVRLNLKQQEQVQAQPVK